MRSKRRKLDGEVRGGLLSLQLSLQHLKLDARLRQARLEEMLKKEEGRCRRPNCWIQVQLQAGQ